MWPPGDLSVLSGVVADACKALALTVSLLGCGLRPLLVAPQHLYAVEVFRSLYKGTRAYLGIPWKLCCLQPQSPKRTSVKN